MIDIILNSLNEIIKKTVSELITIMFDFIKTSAAFCAIIAGIFVAYNHLFSFSELPTSDRIFGALQPRSIGSIKLDAASGGQWEVILHALEDTTEESKFFERSILAFAFPIHVYFITVGDDNSYSDAENEGIDDYMVLMFLSRGSVFVNYMIRVFCSVTSSSIFRDTLIILPDEIDNPYFAMHNNLLIGSTSLEMINDQLTRIADIWEKSPRSKARQNYGLSEKYMKEHVVVSMTSHDIKSVVELVKGENGRNDLLEENCGDDSQGDKKCLATKVLFSMVENCKRSNFEGSITYKSELAGNITCCNDRKDSRNNQEAMYQIIALLKSDHEGVEFEIGETVFDKEVRHRLKFHMK